MFVKYLEMFSESLKAPRKLDEYFEEKGQPCEMPLSWGTHPLESKIQIQKKLIQKFKTIEELLILRNPSSSTIYQLINLILPQFLQISHLLTLKK